MFDAEIFSCKTKNLKIFFKLLGVYSPATFCCCLNPDLRNYVSRILRKSNFTVVSARDGAEGFEIAIIHHPDVIITDLMMPVVSGLDLIKMIREEKQLRGTPIILLTAKACLLYTSDAADDW